MTHQFSDKNGWSHFAFGFPVAVLFVLLCGWFYVEVSHKSSPSNDNSNYLYNERINPFKRIDFIIPDMFQTFFFFFFFEKKKKKNLKKNLPKVSPHYKAVIKSGNNLTAEIISEQK